jgi:ABC-type thiamin/hydroxymethylpyrimidine transport system permease subunit
MSKNKKRLILGVRAVGFSTALIAGGLIHNNFIAGYLLAIVSWNLMTTVPGYISGAA